MKTLLLLTLLFKVSLSFASDECSSRNHIFLIHGISGSEKTFGVMGEYLDKLNECNITTAFEYDTGNSSLTTVNFSESLDNFIVSTTEKNKFKASDRISLIMHSQGGIVGSLWVLYAKSNRPDLYSKIDSFITLSTPYWGSSMANYGGHFFFTLPEDMDNPISPMGRLELREMNYGSVTINFLNENFDRLFRDTHIRFLAVGGMKRGVNAYYGESDTTVSAYSSNPNHIRVKANLTDEVRLDENMDVVPYVPVRATHFKLEIPGVAELEKKCLTTEKCDHPSIGHIVNQLEGKELSFNKDEYTFRKYRIHLYIKGFEDIESLSDLKVVVKRPKGSNVRLALQVRNGELLSDSLNGILNSESGEVTLEFSLKGKKIKSLKVPVRGGFSTFIDFNLK